MSRVVAILVVVACSAILPLSAIAMDRVEVESKSVPGNGTVAIGLYVENDAILRGVVIPVVLRSESGGAYPDVISVRYNRGGRLYPPGAIVTTDQTLLILQYDGEGPYCNDGMNGFAARTGISELEYDVPSPASPDCLVFDRATVFPSFLLLSGSDFPPGTGTPSIVFDVSVPNIPGTVIIDTTCAAPGYRLAFINTSGLETTPSFTSGVITVVPCVCSIRCDYNLDGALDVSDFNSLIEALFFNGPDPEGADCPTTLGDFDFSGFSDSVDLNSLIGHLYFNQPGPIDPCLQ